MYTSGKCPKCGERIEEVALGRLRYHNSPTQFTASTYLCPKCQTILGVGIDPLDLRDSIVRAMKDPGYRG